MLRTLSGTTGPGRQVEVEAHPPPQVGVLQDQVAAGQMQGASGAQGPAQEAAEAVEIDGPIEPGRQVHLEPFGPQAQVPTILIRAQPQAQTLDAGDPARLADPQPVANRRQAPAGRGVHRALEGQADAL